MRDSEFCFWLNGFIELGDGKPPSEAQWNMIKEHLALCFVKVTGNKSTPLKFEKECDEMKAQPTYCAGFPPSFYAQPLETPHSKFNELTQKWETIVPPAPGPMASC